MAALLQLRLLSLALLSAAVGFLAVHLVTHQSQRVRDMYRGYVRDVEREVAFLRWRTLARHIVLGQIAWSCVVLLLALAGMYLTSALMLVPVAGLYPALQARRAKRVAAIEEQLDGWLTALASSLRATPSLGEAIEFSLRLVGSPFREELDTVVKEQRLGEPLDAALNRLSVRVGSGSLSSALATLHIGQRTGGDISNALEKSAGTLREMARLEGVVRVKTAEGKAQGYMMIALPVPLVALLHVIEPNFLQPLVQTRVGHLVIFAAGVAWAASIVAIRRIVRVDI